MLTDICVNMPIKIHYHVDFLVTFVPVPVPVCKNRNEQMSERCLLNCVSIPIAKIIKYQESHLLHLVRATFRIKWKVNNKRRTCGALVMQANKICLKIISNLIIWVIRFVTSKLCTIHDFSLRFDYFFIYIYENKSFLNSHKIEILIEQSESAKIIIIIPEIVVIYLQFIPIKYQSTVNESFCV